jgi:hypothetical protein
VQLVRNWGGGKRRTRRRRGGKRRRKGEGEEGVVGWEMRAGNRHKCKSSFFFSFAYLLFSHRPCFYNILSVTLQLTFMQVNLKEIPKVVKLATSLGIDRVKGLYN